MNEADSFNTAAAHRFFSAHCFNEAWTLIDKPDRSAEDNQRMLALSFASLWHWTQRQDCAERNLSVAYWQLSRVFALLGDVGNATRYGELCLQHSVSEPPFFLAYAHEALARAALLRKDTNRATHYLAEAQKLALEIDAAEDRALLEKDLQSLNPGPNSHH